MKMSDNAFKKVFETITTQSGASDFELALEIIQNHNAIRPTDKDNLNRYMVFLVENLPLAKDPDRVLRIICRSFSSISNVRDMAVNAQKNSEHSEEELAKAIAHFMERKDDVETVVDILKILCEAEVSESVLYSAISKVKKHKKEAVYTQLMNELSKVNAQHVLMSLVNIACNDLEMNEACELVLNCLCQSFSKVDFVDCSLGIMENITERQVAFREHKAELAEILRNGFTSTTSDKLKKSILLVVSIFKIKPQFKKTLAGEDLDYYKKWSS